MYGEAMSKPEQLDEAEADAQAEAPERRSRQVNFAVTESEYQAIKLAAEIVEVSVAELAMRIVTGICDPRALNSRHTRPALIVMDARLNRVDVSNKLARLHPETRAVTAGSKGP